MPRIVVETVLPTAVDVAFDMARSIDLHLESQQHSGERAIAGCTEGLIELGESVVWEATHFGVWQELESRIVSMDRPRAFRDSMVRGAFARFDHDHLFEDCDGGTLMTDIFDYSSPWWLLGRLADALFLEGYMRRLLGERAEMLRALAEEHDDDALRERLGGKAATAG
jgi:hypothetical protein